MTGTPDKAVSLPACLRRVCARHFALAGLLFLATTFLAVYVRTPQCYLGYGMSVWLLYPAFRIQRDWRQGGIAEKTVTCASIRLPPSGLLPHGGSTRVVFRTDGEEPDWFRFTVPGTLRTVDAQARYRIYYRPSRPDRLLGYEEL